MELHYQTYPFTPILGWSISRYELFNKCKRQYFYTYYSKYATNVPQYKLNQLKQLTSVPLEIGNVVHDVLEAFLRRLQKSDSSIDEKRFFEFAHKLSDQYFSSKTFLEIYYNQIKQIDMQKVYDKIDTCLISFINSHCYSWIFMVAMRDRSNWMIEPAGYGETRLDGLKAYCKMDFLLPVDDCIYILDWKTGSKDVAKHTGQLLGYAAAASSNFGISWDRIFPKIIYLFPVFDELEIKLDDTTLMGYFETIRTQTEEMYGYCSSVKENKPSHIDAFELRPSPGICRQCRFQELCFTDKASSVGSAINTSVALEF